MIRSLFCLIAALSVSLVTPAAPVSPVRLILDTDMGNDIDDTLALAMIHALEDRGEVNLLAVTITKDNRYAGPFIDLMNTYYGRPDIPIGVVRNGKTPQDADMIRVPAEQRDSSGALLFPHRLLDGSQAPEAVSLLTRILRQQPDGSVTIAQIGFSTNLARLLQSPGGRALVAQKVKLLALMGGNFTSGPPEYNIYTDPEAAAILMREWPTPMVFSGFEIGLGITFPYRTYTNGFKDPGKNPVVSSALAYLKKPEDRAAWDPTAVLYAIRPDEDYFRLSEPGRVSLGEKSTTVFQPDPQGLCRYLILNPEKTGTVRQLLVDLVTEPAAILSRR